MTTELKFKRWFLNRFEGWSESYEPRRGSGVGMPDVQLLVGGQLLPVELKVGRFDPDDGSLWISGFEPAQISWHDRFFRAGGLARVCVGVPDGKTWTALRLTQWAELSDWRLGFRGPDFVPWSCWKG